MSRFTSPAVVKAIALTDPHGLSIAPERVAETLQRHLSELITQGYEVLSVTLVHGALLSVAVTRDAGRSRVRDIGELTNRDGTTFRWYGCEGLTCRPNAHTLECPNIDQSK
jgi:hypothetical protein